VRGGDDDAPCALLMDRHTYQSAGFQSEIPLAAIPYVHCSRVVPISFFNAFHL